MRSGIANSAPTTVSPGIRPEPVSPAKTARQVPIAIQAATVLNGLVQPAEFQIMQSGNLFYVLSTSAPLTIQPVRAGSIGGANIFGTAQGQPVSDGFETLSIKNFSLFPIVALIWVGYDNFINDQLTLVNSSYAQVARPTYKNPASAPLTKVVIDDISGQPFLDINGNKWGALARVAILVFNTDSGQTLLLQGAASNSGAGDAIGVIYPLTPVRFDLSGDYSLNNGGSNINAVVSEIYNAIPL
jgi:hypothetical protein